MHGEKELGKKGGSPWSGRLDFSRTATNAANAPGIVQPGPVLRKRVKRGKRISRNRTANDAAQALSKSMEKPLKEYAR